MLVRTIVAPIAALCVFFPPSATAQASTGDPLGIDYRLPISTAVVQLDLTLASCTPAQLVAAPTLTLTAGIGVSPETYRVQPTRSRWWTRQDLKIALAPNGTISSINGGATDQRGAMALASGKFVVSLIPLVGGFSEFLSGQRVFDGLNLSTAQVSGLRDRLAWSEFPTVGADLRQPSCKPEILQALGQVDQLQNRILSLRQSLVTDSPEEAVKTQKAIDVLALEVARLRTGPLRLSVTRTVDLRSSKGPIPLAREEVARLWLAPGATSAFNFDLNYCVRPSGVSEAVCTELDAPPPQAAPCSGEACHGLIVMRDPSPAVLTVSTAADSTLGASSNDLRRAQTLGSIPIAMPQWGPYRTLALTATTGEQWKAGLTFDGYGRQTAVDLSSEARGTALATTLDGSASSLASGYAAVRGDDAAQLNAQSAELEAELKLNKLLQCQAAIAAGSAVCPDLI